MTRSWLPTDQHTNPGILPEFPGGELPPPETLKRRLAIRATAVFAIGVSVAYLVWRTAFTVSLAYWWVSLPFLLLEIHAVFSLTLFAFSLWDIDARPVRHGSKIAQGRIAVLIPTYDESSEILIPTIAAAVALEPQHETWVLDDGCRKEIEDLATELGARYLSRKERAGAKAGNINRALEQIDVDFIGVLDADHVAQPGFLGRTLEYFHDSRVALVQTPQDFYNFESFEHEATPADPTKSNALYHEQTLFYRVIQPGKNRWNAAFWCGTGAVVRVAALRDIGGLATETVTEDIHTTIRLHRRGWKTVYHNEVLARGLAAGTAEQFQAQRLRWGTGAMQVLRAENPIIVPGLSLGQRLAYATTLLGWFEAWRSLGYVLLPIAVLLTGGMPVRAPLLTFAIAFGVAFVSQQVALRVLSRGHHRLILPLVFDIVRMTPNMLSTLTLLRPGRPTFHVTPKGRQSDKRRKISAPPLLIALLTLSLTAGTWFLLTLGEMTPLHYEDRPFAFGAAFWLIFNTGLICIAIARIRAEKFGPERRSAIRFGTALAGTFDGHTCAIQELSLTGAQIVLNHEPDDAHSEGRHGLTIGVVGEAIGLGAKIRWRRQGTDGQAVFGLEFVGGQTDRQARLSLALLRSALPVKQSRQAAHVTSISARARRRVRLRASSLPSEVEAPQWRLPALSRPADTQHSGGRKRRRGTLPDSRVIELGHVREGEPVVSISSAVFERRVRLGVGPLPALVEAPAWQRRLRSRHPEAPRAAA